VALLDDPDEEVFENVFNRLCEYGPAVIPSLETEWMHNLDETVQKRLETLIHTIQFDFVKSELKTWALTDSNNLLKALLIINKYYFPDADNQKIIEQIESLKKNIWLELNYQLTPLEQIRVFNLIFFNHCKYEPNIENIHDPKNNFLSFILESKKSNPIGLSLLYLLIAQQVRLPVYGVCLKNYFVLCFIDADVFHHDSGMMNARDILYYINPYNKGAIFKREEILAYLRRIKAEPKDKYFFPANNIDIVKELLTNLLQNFEMQNQQEKAEEILFLKNLLK
jgi:regulator of sirC expression with transglutaminase-like and TPR domain